MKVLTASWRGVLNLLWGSKSAPIDSRKLNAEHQRAEQRTTINYWNSQ